MHRFTDTEKWKEDWYCDLKGEYQKLWDYICDHCDNAGIWKPNRIDFEIKTGFKVSLDSFFKKVNGDKLRIVALANGRWFILGFIQYQWFTKLQTFNLVLTNPRHKHIYDLLVSNDIPLEKVRGLKEVWKTSMAKAKGEEEGIGGSGEREGDPLGSERVSLVANKVWSDQRWKENICIGNQLKPDDLQKWMAQFNASVCNDAMPDFTESKYKKLFGGWLNKQRSKGYDLPKATTTQPQTSTLKVPDLK
jgi:hypothetical protein